MPSFELKQAKARIDLQDGSNILEVLDSIQSNYQIFCVALHECFLTASTDEQIFIQLRNSVVLDTLTYQKALLPIVKQTLRIIRQVADYFSACVSSEQDILQNSKDIRNLVGSAVNSLKYLSLVHDPVLDKSFIHSLDAQKALDFLSQKDQELESIIMRQKQEIQKDIQTQKKCNSYSSYIPLGGFLATSCAKLFGDLKSDTALLQSKQQLVSNIENKEIIVRAINIVGSALMPALQNYFDSLEQLLKIFKVIEKSVIFIDNQAISQDYRSQKAIELYNYIVPIAKKLSNMTITVSGTYSNSESLINAVENKLYQKNYLVQWNLMFQSRQDQLLSEIEMKENEHFKELGLAELQIPQVCYIQKYDAPNMQQYNEGNDDYGDEIDNQQFKEEEAKQGAQQNQNDQNEGRNKKKLFGLF